MDERKYPIGIQTFETIRNDGYVYVDKTKLVYDMVNAGKYFFLSRPRRFGKSLLVSTFQSYFEGRKDLFEGLAISNLEKEWTTYPVIHLDLSLAKSTLSAEELMGKLHLLLRDYVRKYDTDEGEVTPGGLLRGLIRRAYQRYNRPVVVLIDEYDAPLLDVLHNEESLKDIRIVMQEFYQPLKACEAMIRYCFITGITKFSQLSIFSTINNIRNVSMLPKYAAICGITEEEMTTVLAEDVTRMAVANGCTPEAMHQRLKYHYDGYHFAFPSEDVYNPYSLLNAFADQRLGQYWFSTGTPTFLIHQMRYFHTDITSLENMEASESAFDRPTESMATALPLLYQSGYLTIKAYDKESMMYTLSIPNQEVRIGLTDGLLPAYIGLEGYEVQAGFALKFWRSLKMDDIESAMQELKAYMAGLPYVEGFKRKLADVATAEGFYEWTFYLIFTMLNVYVQTQVKCVNGRTDIVVSMPNTIYIMELKVNGSAQDALTQIYSKGYAIPYTTDGRRVVNIGISFSTDTRSIEEWAIG